MNRKISIYCGITTILALAAISSLMLMPAKTETVQTDTPGGYYIAEWTLAKRCIDGTEIYQLADGDYAIWVGVGEEKDHHWVKLTPGVEPDQYCN